LGARGLYLDYRAAYISARLAWTESKMRAETERTIGEIKQALALLRRHL
jgi:hypothetical protein